MTFDNTQTCAHKCSTVSNMLNSIILNYQLFGRAHSFPYLCRSQFWLRSPLLQIDDNVGNKNVKISWKKRYNLKNGILLKRGSWVLTYLKSTGRSYNCMTPRNYNTTMIETTQKNVLRKLSENEYSPHVWQISILVHHPSVKRIVSLVLYKINATLIFLQHHLQSRLKSTNVKWQACPQFAFNKIKLAGNQWIKNMWLIL